MSDRVGIKPKENAGKKFSSLNLNQTYKGTKVEPKTTTGVSRHGLQSLGKVAASRRMPPPANLPSLKSENLGNDPTVALVPSGGGGWGSGKEKEASTSTPTVVVPVQNPAQGPTGSNQQQAQQPLKPTEALQKPAATPTQQTSTGQTTTNQTSATSTKTWASSSSVAGGQEKTSYPHQSQYFNQEFPTLGGGNLGDRQLEERASHPPYGQPPRNMHDPPWLDKGGPGPPPQPPSGMYNGAQPRAGYDMHAHLRDGHPANQPPRPEGSGTFPYMGQSRPPNHSGHPPPQRGHPNSRYGGPAPRNAVRTEDSPSVYARPSILKEDDIRAMDAEDMDDGGWAGAQEEIDYSVKLNFDDEEPSGGGERNVKNQEDRAMYGDENRAQEPNKHPPMRRQAWSGTGRGDSDRNYQQQQQQWHEPGKQGPPYHPQRAWPGAHPMQQRNSFPMGPPSGFPPPGMHQTDGRRIEHHGPEGSDRPRMKERNSVIEQARQRREQEELERTRQREAAAREKLKMLDAKPRQLHIQTHENYTREQAGPRSPLSPAGSDTQVRRIMRRKDSESATGDDDASIKSVESGGKEERTDSRKNENQARETRERLRKTSSSDLPEEGKPRLKGIKEERKAPGSPKPAKEKTEEKASIEKDVQSRKTSVEKEPQVKTVKPQRQGADLDTKRWKTGEESADLKSKVENKEQDVAQLDRRDVKKRTEDQERRREGPERKSNENLRRREEINRKKDQVVETKKEFPEKNKDGYEGRKENMDRVDYLDSKNERGSSESLRSRDSLDRRKDDRKRGEDAIKRKRDDFERTEPVNERGNRGHRERLSSAGRGRGHPGGKSSLRGHPKSYSHARTERTQQQRRTSQRTKDFVEEDVKSIPAEEKRQVSDKGGEMRQPDGERGRKDQYQDSRSFGVDKRNERQSKDDRSYKGGSGRFPTRPMPDQRGDRAGRFRDTTKNKGGFGVPARKQLEETKENVTNSRNEERSNAKVEPDGEAKPVVLSVDSSKAEKKEIKTTDVVRSGDHSKVDDSNKTDQRKDKERFDYTSPVTNAWAKPERKETTKEVKSEVDSRRNVEQQGNDTASEDLQKSAPITSAKDTRRDRKPSGHGDRPGSSKRDTNGQRDRIETGDEGKSSFVKDSKNGENVTKADERRERIESYNGDRKQQGRDRQDQSGDRAKQGVVRREEGGDRPDQSRDRREQGGDGLKQGGDRRDQGRDRREQAGDGLKQGGDRREQGGDRREQGGDRREQGGFRREQGGDRPKQGGEGLKQGGDRREQGGERPKQGGDRREQGVDRLKQQGGDRLKQGGDRREQGGDRLKQGGDRRGQGGDRREQGGDRPVQEAKSNRGLPKVEFRDSKTEEKTRSEPRGENRRKFDEQRERAGPRDDLRRETDWKTNERRPRVENRREQESKAEERRDRTTQRDGIKQRQESKSDQRPYPTTQRDDLRQESKSDQRREPTTQRDDLQQRQETKSDQRREPATQRDDLQQRQETKSDQRREPATQRDDLQQRQETKSDQRREPATQRDDLQQRQETKSDQRREPTTQRDGLQQRQETKSDQRREPTTTQRDGLQQRQETKSDQRREPATQRDDLQQRQETKSDQRREPATQRDDLQQRQETKSDQRREPTTQRDGLQQRQETKSDQRREPTTTQRDGLQQRQETKSDQRREPTTQRDDHRQRQESKSDERRERTTPRKDSKNDERRERITPRNEPYKRQERKPDEQRDRTEPRGEPRNNKQEVKPEDRESWIEQGESRRGQASKTEERNNGTEQYKDSRDEQSATTKSGDRFTIGLTGSERQGTDRGRFRDSRRGGLRRGGRGSSRTSRGRARPGLHGSGRITGRGSTVSKDDDDDSDESGKYHSANSLVDEDSDESDTEVFPKQDDGNKDERSARSQPSGGGTRPHYTTSRTRGKGRGSSPMSSRNQRKTERPPRFLKQEQERGAVRGRGKSGRGLHTGFSTKGNWDDRDSEKNYDRSNKNFEEGPSPKKRSPGNLQDTSYASERSSSGLKGKKPTRNGQGNKSSFLVKKQQEAVEGSRKESSRSSAGPKSTLPAALNQARNERRGKNDSVPDLDDIPEPPKKNPRRAEPTRMGIEHIDMSNIAGFIDIDDIFQPASETEPASPQSGFVEVKSKRTQKEARERAREDEERKRRETEKMMVDAMLKPKAHKPNNSNKSHQTSKPPRFARNNMPPNQVPSVTRVSTPPGTVPLVLSPENSVCVIPPATSDQKRTSPLMMEKPSSPAPPPMFNAWTKPLSITPAKPQNVPVEMAMAVRPDPLAVGSGKPMRLNGTQPKSEEPGLQIQLKLPDTFQEMPAERNMESQSTETPVLIGDGEVKKRDVDTDAIATPNQKTDAKIAARTTESSTNNEKVTAVNEKRQGSNRFTRPPRFEKTTPPMKRNVDGRKFKGDIKEQNGEAKSQPSTGDVEKVPKEKSEDRPRSGSRPRELNKNPKSKPQVKAAKPPPDADGAEAQSTDKNSQEKVSGTPNEGHPKLNKRDSAELDVDSMSDSLLDEAPLGVRMVETSESASGPPSMDKISTEDDIKMDHKMKEKMVAAKKAWDDSLSSSASMVVTSPKWKKSSVSDGDNTESNETSVMDQIPRPSSEVEESAEPITSSPSTRLKKPSNGEQQNVCKVKPQQQQQPAVKPQPVSSDVPEEFPTSHVRTRPRADLQTQTSYPIQPTAVFSSKTTSQYPFTFDQAALLSFNQHYVQAANIATVQHTPTVRPQALRPTSQSPPQRTAVFSQGQPMSTPSPLSQQPVLQDTFRPLMQTPLYSTTNYPNNQYFISPVVRQATPQFTDEVSNSVYTLPPSKSQAAGHGYEQSVAPNQHVFMSVEQPYLDHTQPQRQQTLAFYPDNTNQASLTSNIPHVQTAMAFQQQADKRMQQHTRDNRPGHHEQQVYPTSGQSEMVKHLNAKPFQPPVNSPTANVTHQMVAPNRHMTAVSGPTSVSPVYQMNSAVVSMHAAGIVPGGSSPSTHSGTSSIVTQAHSMPVSRVNFHQYQAPVGSYPRHQVQMPVQSLPQAAYATGMTYRTPVPTYPSSSVGNQPGMIVQQKSFPMVRQLVTQGRGAPLTHRVPEPIQRPNKPGIPGGMLSSNPKERLANQPLRPKSGHQPFVARRGISQIHIRGVAPPQPQMMSYQPPPQQAAPPQQQQMFRSQQRQLMLSGVQQFFAENKGMEQQHHRKHAPDQQKRELAPVNSGDSGQQTSQDRKQPAKTQQETKSEIKPQKSTKKDEQKKPEYKYEKRSNNRQQERKEVRTAQIQPQRNQTRSQTRPKLSAPKQEPVKTMEQLSAVEPAKTEQSIEKIEARPELKESQAEVVQTPLV